MRKPTKIQLRELLVNEISAWEQRKIDAEKDRDTDSNVNQNQEYISQCAVYWSHSKWLLDVMDGKIGIPGYEEYEKD